MVPIAGMAYAKTQSLLLRNVVVPLEAVGDDPSAIAARWLHVKPSRVVEARVVRRNVDARRGRPKLVLHLLVELDSQIEQLPRDASEAPGPVLLPEPPAVPGGPEVAVVGTGPAGLFAAWRLCRAGIEPLVIERGPSFPRRHEAVSGLLGRGELDREANFHFGLGGAGTYSDGKLYTRLDRPAVRTVLKILQRHGAGSADEILIDAHPHVGSDRWPPTIENFIAELRKAGCRFLFGSLVTGVRIEKGRLTGLKLADGAVDCRAAVLAPGNSSRDLFAALHAQGVDVEPKAFAVGVRMTHPQDLIDRIQYGDAAGHPALGPATYRLSGRFAGRAVYSFCTCPGGAVIPTPTEPQGLAINGMSSSARDSGEANAGIVVAVGREDFPSDDPLAGVELQRELERAAFRAGGGGFRAPAQTLLDFLAGRPSSRIPACRYRPGVEPADLSTLLPYPLASALLRGLAAFCKKMRGLDDPSSVILGVETRTSSPVRIRRGPGGACPAAEGLFPAGEGAGYAGGISSSAADGIRQADALIAWLLD